MAVNDEWQCPWCGLEWETGVEDSQRSLQAWDAWIEAHVSEECETARLEMGMLDSDDQPWPSDNYITD